MGLLSTVATVPVLSMAMMRVRQGLWNGPSISECEAMNIRQIESHRQCEMEPVSEPPGITSPQMG